MNLRTLRLDNLVIHRIPRTPEAGQSGGPVFSDLADPQTNDVRVFFRDRLTGVMTDRGFPIKRDPTQDGTAIDAIGAILADATTLVVQSRIIAQRLYDVQDRRSPEGILAVAFGEVDSLPCVGILKLEHERGIRAEEDTQDGQRLFRIILHRDLLLTQKTQVFKGALARHRSASNTMLSAMASDLQVERHVASFFLEEFLGCQLVDSAPVATEKFFDAAEGWVAARDDAEKQHRYEVALLATMHSAEGTVDPVRFADNSLDADEHQSFIDHLTQRGVRTARFPKDTSNIEGRIKRLAYNFESGISLVGTPDAMDEHVRIVSEQEQSQVIVEDQIKAIRARG